MSFESNKMKWAHLLWKKHSESSFAQFRASGAWLGPSLHLLFSQWRNHVKQIKTKQIKTCVLALIWWIGHVCCEKIIESSFAQFRASGGRPGPSSYLPFSKWWNRAKRIKTWVLWLMRWIRYFCCEKKNLHRLRSHSFTHSMHDPDLVCACWFHSGKITRDASKHKFWV